MTEIYFKNLDVSKEKEIKIYSLGKDDTLPLSSQFTSLDNFNKAIGIKLLAANGSVISCVGATSRLYWTNNVRVTGQTEVNVAWTINGVTSNASYISDGPINALSLDSIFRQKMNLNIPGFSHNNDGWLFLEIVHSEHSEYNPDLEDVRIDIKTLGTIATIPDVNDELSPAVWLSEDNREMKICITKPIPA